MIYYKPILDYTPRPSVTSMTYGNFYYWIVLGNRNQTEAELNCSREYNGTLVNITDEVVLNNVTDLINRTEEFGEYFWISKNGTNCMIIDTDTKTKKKVDCEGMYSHICVRELMG